LALLHDPAEAVTHLAVAFDNPIRSFRNDLFDAYKSDEGMEPGLRQQFDAVEEAVRALGVTVWSMDRFEADDALATGAARFASQVEQVRLLTPDKDLGQCLQGQSVVQVDRRQQRLIDEPAFRQLRGFGPRSMPDYLALVGDTADGIPGLPGFGERSAGALLGVYPHLEDIPVDASSWRVQPRGAARLAASFSAGRGEALLYRELATLIETVPLSQTLEDLRFEGVPRPAFEAWCTRLGVSTLRSAPKRWAEDIGRPLVARS
jgi:5'-3' exonuclease